MGRTQWHKCTTDPQLNEGHTQSRASSSFSSTSLLENQGPYGREHIHAKTHAGVVNALSLNSGFDNCDQNVDTDHGIDSRVLRQEVKRYDIILVPSHS
ncbi:Hypothetical predicted protein [Octopus vulgaris]|uniref:Uncharacterized protein n=1 Tax=Octopus vulgaris TaxID=6645 RepID=A0AA36BMG6_OCTVU|nr:Hypothetical predicted protein [Octopus vulgaris]